MIELNERFRNLKSKGKADIYDQETFSRSDPVKVIQTVIFPSATAILSASFGAQCDLDHACLVGSTDVFGTPSFRDHYKSDLVN